MSYLAKYKGETEIFIYAVIDMYAVTVVGKIVKWSLYPAGMVNNRKNEVSG